MATISNGPRAPAPTGYPWVLKTAGALALATTLTLAGCGGGGGSSTPEVPTVTPVSASPAVITVAANTDGTVMVKSDVPMAASSSISWADAAANQVSHALTLSADKKSGIVSLGGATSVVNEGVTAITGTVTFADGVPPAQKVSATITWCPTGTKLSGAKWCMVPAWITDNMVVVSASPATVAQRMIRFFDGSSSKDYVLPTGTLNCAVNAVELGAHGGALVTCNGVKGYDVDGTYEVSPTYTKKLDPVVRFDEVNYKSANPSTWWMKTTLCGGGTGWEIPGSKVCYAQKNGNDILISPSGVISGEMQSLQSAIAAASLK